MIRFVIEERGREWEVLEGFEDLGFWQGASSTAEKLRLYFSGRAKLEGEQISDQRKGLELKLGFSFLRVQSR